MIDDGDRYWGPASGHSWKEQPAALRRISAPRCSTARTMFQTDARPAGDDRIAPEEVEASNAIMVRMGLRTRYDAAGRPYLIDDEGRGNDGV